MCDEFEYAVAAANVANEATIVERKQQQYGLSVFDAAATALISVSSHSWDATMFFDCSLTSRRCIVKTKIKMYIAALR
jgi:hypothetical protein